MRFFVLGIVIALCAPLLILIATTVSLIQSYDGKCGGELPWLAAAAPCSLKDYVVGNITLLAMILWYEYWPFTVAGLILPIGIGYVLDRQRGRST